MLNFHVEKVPNDLFFVLSNRDLRYWNMEKTKDLLTFHKPDLTTRQELPVYGQARAAREGLRLADALKPEIPTDSRGCRQRFPDLGNRPPRYQNLQIGNHVRALRLQQLLRLLRAALPARSGGAFRRGAVEQRRLRATCCL